METTTVHLAEAKARLSELTDLAAAGEEIVITKHGRPVARLVGTVRPREAIDAAALRAFTDRLCGPVASTDASIRRLRDDARY